MASAPVKQPVQVDPELRQAELRLVERLGGDRRYSGSSNGSGSKLRQPQFLTQSWQQSEDDYDDYLDGDPGSQRSKPRTGTLVPIPDPVSTTQAGEGLTGCPTDACLERIGPWTMPQPWLAHRLGIRFGGWVDHGISVVANNPADGYNGVLPFNDRYGEYQMNQLWMYMERATDTSDGGWDLGGRVDFLFGTDARFTKSVDGLEANWDQRERFYQAALPQFYFDVAYNKLTLRMGKFWTLIGYEVVPAVGNFFYSHAYTHQYCEPYTHLGMLLIYKLNEHWTFTNGLHRGNDQFDDTDGLNAVDYLGGITWTGLDGRVSISFAISATEQGPDIQQTVYSLIGTWQVTERLKYVIEHDNSQMTGVVGAQGYGLNQYFLYRLNDAWAAGMRVEWFRDDDGTRVIPIGDGNRNIGPYVGDFYEITLGLNWTPHPNIRVRPEVRWDWFEPDVPGGIGPYDAGDRDEPNPDVVSSEPDTGSEHEYADFRRPHRVEFGDRIEDDLAGIG